MDHVTAVILVLGCIINQMTISLLCQAPLGRVFVQIENECTSPTSIGHTVYIGAGAGAPALPGVYIAAAATKNKR